jgi:Fibronectin type III domain
MKKSDIVWYNSQTGETQIWYMDVDRLVDRGTVLSALQGDPNFGNPALVGPPWSIVGCGDMNGSGKADIVWYNSQTGETQVWYMDEHRLVDRGTVVDEVGNFIPIGPPFSIVGVGDMDGRGKTDIVWYHSQTGETQVWYMDGHRIITRKTVRGLDGNAVFIGPPWSIVGTGLFGPAIPPIPDRPTRPTDLRVTDVADRKISVSWRDRSFNESGFRIRFRGERAGFFDHNGTRTVGRNETSASLTGLHNNTEYTISIAAFNDGGQTGFSGPVRATTPARSISVSNEGVGTSAVFVITGAGFTPTKLVVIRITAAHGGQVQFRESAGVDGRFVSRHSVPCVSGQPLTFTAFEDDDPFGTTANDVVTACP